MSRSALSSRIAARAGVVALSVATAASLAVPVATADEAGTSGSSQATPETGGSDAADIVTSVAKTDWATLLKVLAALSTGTVNSSTLAGMVQLSADSDVDLAGIIGLISGSSGDKAEAPAE
ncbi:hypothetical protein ACTXO6_13220 [Corynebacterium variabile]|uniref:hypothetical protein n=1 Tax=Corynebacterium variabile TaxID=1727 RepID=UPI003FD0E28A